MPRPKQGVTAANALKVDRYFARALQFDRFQGKGWFKNHSDYLHAKAQFQRLPAVLWKNAATQKQSLEKRRKALQQWIDNYIPNDKWQRCLLTLRQAKSRQKLDLRPLHLKASIYRAIKIIAKKRKTTMGEVIRKFAETTLAKIYKTELNIRKF